MRDSITGKEVNITPYVIDGRVPDIIPPATGIMRLIQFDEQGNPVEYFVKDVKDDIIEELDGDQDTFIDGMEAYHDELSPLLEEIYEPDVPTLPSMKTDSRRTMHQGPKGNIYPSPKRRK